MDLASKDSTLTFNQIRLFTAFISLLLSGLSFYFDDLINRDGVMYMEMVEAYMIGGLKAMAEIYDWPFFTLLVAWLSKATYLPIELTSNIVNSLLYVVYTDALLLISRQVLPNLRQVTIAAVLILSFYSINEYRDYVIRDVGYWAFTSLALYHLIRYLNVTSWASALLWQSFAMMAVLFRIEGLVLLMALPLYALLGKPIKSGMKQVLQLNSMVLPVAGIVVVAAISMSGLAEAFDKLDNYMSYLNTDALQLNLDERLRILEEDILSPFSADYSTLILFSGLSVMLLLKLVEGLSIGYILILLLAWRQSKSRLKASHRGLLVWFFIVNVVVLLAFLFTKYFVVTRYCIMAITGLFLLVLPTLTRFIEECREQKRHFLTGFIAFLVVTGVIDTFHTTNSKSYIKDTAIWASHNLQADNMLITDDEYIQYYLKREQTPVRISYRPQGLGDYRQYDYIILVEKRRELPNIEKFNGITLTSVYQQVNRRGNKATVYKVEGYED